MTPRDVLLPKLMAGDIDISAISAEELVVRFCALGIGDFALGAPDYEPISRIGDMALIVASPFTREAMHVVPAFQDVHGFGIVLPDTSGKAASEPASAIRSLLRGPFKQAQALAANSPR